MSNTDFWKWFIESYDFEIWCLSWGILIVFGVERVVKHFKKSTEDQ